MFFLGYIRIWDPRQSKCVNSILLHPGGAINGIDHASQLTNAPLITVGADSIIHVSDPRKSFESRVSFDTHCKGRKYFVYSLLVINNLILTGSENGWLAVHDITIEKCRYALGANKGAVTCIAVTNDAQNIICAGDDGNAMIYDF